MGYHWNWGVLFSPVPTGDATYLDWVLAGLRMTVVLSLSAWLLALVIGTIMGVLRTLPGRWLPRVAAVYVEIFRGIPLIVQLFIWFFVAPEVIPGGQAFKQIDPALQFFLASFVCLGLFTGARVCEQVRAGIQSIPRGQRNAALALGFTLAQTYRYVLLPLTARRIIPPLTSETLNIVKNSSVCSTLGVVELVTQARQLLDYTAQPFESFLVVTILYPAINLPLMLLMHLIERRARIPGFLGSGR